MLAGDFEDIPAVISFVRAPADVGVEIISFVSIVVANLINLQLIT